MTDITKIPTEELQQDRLASLEDIQVCEKALQHGITTYSGGSVQRRLDVNRKIVECIDAELKRREAPQE